MNKEEIIRSVLLPNDTISKGYETISVLTFDGDFHNGFIISEDDTTLSLGIADGKQIDILLEDIEQRKDMKASSMPEGLIKQIAPIEFLNLIKYLEGLKAISMDVRAGGWIGAKTKSPSKLREHKGFKEISRDGSIQLGKTMTNPTWHSDSHLFLQDVKSNSEMDFVFHSAHETESPAITIQLPKVSEVRHIWLQNRLSSQFYSRADGLTIWASLDGKEFKKVWAADKSKADWMVDLPAGTQAKYLRVGLDGAGTFHLNRGVVYGK
jgi:putative heme-binding domain-containing protein